MENLTETLESLLNNNETLEKLKEISGIFNNNQEESSENDSSFSAENIKMIMKIMPLISSIKQEDKNTRFLRALKPLLNEKKQVKIDESIKFLQILKLLPVLKKQNIF